MHHFREWQKNQDCPIALCTDDVGIFGSTLSNEYLLAGQHFGLTQSDMIDLSRRAVSAAFVGRDRMMNLIHGFEETESHRKKIR